MLFELLRARGRAAVCVSALLGFSGLAVAGAGEITTVVTALSGEVTYSRVASLSPKRDALDTYVGYSVEVASATSNTNTINNIRFNGKTVVAGGAGNATFAGAEGASCTESADLTAIDCNIGQLKAGAAYPKFYVFFKAPVAPAGGATGSVDFSGTTFYAEGTGGLDTSVPPNSARNWGAPQVGLGTVNNVRVKTAVRNAGGRLFTGDSGITTGTDQFATLITVPAGDKPTTAEVNESQAIPVCTDLASCDFETRVDAAANNSLTGKFSPYLRITLRIDSTLTKSRTLNNISIYYKADSAAAGIGEQVFACATADTPRGDGKPCINSKKAYKNSRNGKDFPVELEGDFEFELLNDQNGSYKGF